MWGYFLKLVSGWQHAVDIPTYAVQCVGCLEDIFVVKPLDNNIVLKIMFDKQVCYKYTCIFEEIMSWFFRFHLTVYLKD